LGPLAKNVVIDIRGFERGAPSFRVGEAVGSVLGKCLGVSVQAADLNTDISAWRGLRLSAVSVDLGLVEATHGSLRRELHGFSHGAAGVAPAIVAYSISSRARMLMAWAEGFTHLSGERLSEQTQGSLTPVRYRPADLYTDQPRKSEVA
jgi:hypothetical protein